MKKHCGWETAKSAVGIDSSHHWVANDIGRHRAKVTNHTVKEIVLTNQV
jgi:hypothetical protein